jgi:hypothetical protein
LWAPLLPWSHWRPISRREANYRPPKRQRLRDRFTDSEILRMQQCAMADPFAQGLLTFVLHTGCRTGAVCHLLVRDVQDPVDRMRILGTVREKGGVVRCFCIDPILAEALGEAIRCNRGSDYVFPANGGVHRRNKSQNAAWLQQLCQRAGVSGSHVHMHAIRRTVISRLLDCGNTLSAVSSWIGHSSPTMTYAMAPVLTKGGTRAPSCGYWERDPTTIQRNMYLPWLGGAGAPPDSDDSDTDIALTETMVCDLMHKNQQLTSNLHTLQRAYNQLLTGESSKVNGHGAGGPRKGRPQ